MRDHIQLPMYRQIVSSFVKKKAHGKYLVIFIALFGLSGCDFIYGIHSDEITVKVAPDEPCILETLRKTPQVVDVNEKIQRNEGWTIAGTGPVHGSNIRYINYRVGSDPRQVATLMIEDVGNGEFRYTVTMMTMNEKLPTKEILGSLPIIRRAMKRVSSACNLHIESGLVYRCVGYECR